MTGNQLKILALVTMTVDHIGVVMFPDVMLLRVIGRLSFPIFAYMIAEGCYYTHSKPRYLGLLVAVGVLCQIVYFVVEGSLYQSIMTTFALAVVTIYAIQLLDSRADFLGLLACVGALALDVFLAAILPELLVDSDYAVDYGLAGVLVPVLVYASRLVYRGDDVHTLRALMLVFCGVGLVCVAATTTGSLAWVQWFGLAALVPLAFYNGERGTWNLKYLFYVYYPVHLAVIWGIEELVSGLAL